MVKHISRLLSFFRRRGIKSPKVRKSRESLGGGHRGVAIGSRAAPNYSAENVAKWVALPGDQVEKFVYEAEPFFVHSTNVQMMQYFIEDQSLLVEFRDGTAYKYENVTEDEAIQAAKAPSKGFFVWDNLRIRGTKLGHKKPYKKVSGGYQPPKRESEITEIDGVQYEVIREAGGGIRYRAIE